MPAKIITYKGSTIWTTADSGRGWQHAPEVIAREIETVGMPLGDGVLWKDGGAMIATHAVTLLYEVANVSAAGTLRLTLGALVSATPGTLVLPSGLNINAAIVKSVEFGRPRKSSGGYLIEALLYIEESA